MASAPVDTYVHLRRVTNKPPKASERTARGNSGWRLARLFRRPLERQIIVVILSGMFVGCIMHAIVYWHGMVAMGRHPSNTLAQPLGAQSLNARAMQRRMASGGRSRDRGDGQAQRVAWTPPGSPPLGMPGDSDSLPNTPVWDAAAWARDHPGTEKISPENAAWPNTLAVCAMMKSEHPDDVVQWLRYHKCAAPPRFAKRVASKWCRRSSAVLDILRAVCLRWARLRAVCQRAHDQAPCTR